MESNNLTRVFTTLRLLLVCLALCSFNSAWAADYNSLVSQARKQLENEQYAEALATAKEAVSKKSKDYQGHYYAAMAHMSLGQFDDAEAEVATALRQAPKSAKPAVGKLVNAIKDGRKAAEQSLGKVKKKEIAKAEDSAASKDIFLECTGTQTIKRSKSLGGGTESKQIKSIFRLNSSEISEWVDGHYQTLCHGKSEKYACSNDNKSFYYSKDRERRDSTSITKTLKIFSISRESGLFKLDDHYSVDNDDGTRDYEAKEVKDGVCIPCPEPTPPKPVPNKF